jgi:signal transduction histidine kinase
VKRHRPHADDGGVTLELDVEEGLPPVLADAPRVAQVVGNLLGNALRFTPRGGRVLVQARPARSDEVMVTVRDNGPGIPAEDLPHVFDRFWRTERAGHGAAGLGLSIAKAIVEAQGGSIWVESTPGTGAAFSFTLPIALLARESGPEAQL